MTDDYLCPNCCTPWKCNGPHIPEPAPQPSAEPVAPKCGAIIEVFDKGWQLEYLSLPVGRHKLYVQEYTYTHPQPDDTALLRQAWEALEWIEAQPEPRMIGAAKIIAALRERLK